MSTITPSRSRTVLSVQATLDYMAPSEQPLCTYIDVEPPPGEPLTNEVKDPRRVSISNLRDLDEPTSVDVQGFQVVPFRTSVRDIYDPLEREAVFVPEAAALVRHHTGAIEARVFSPFLRGAEAQRRAPGTLTAPADLVHVDYTECSGPDWFERVLGAEAERYRGCRFAVINVWRPIVGPLQDRPLAMCDARTLAPQDMATLRMVTRVDAETGLHSADGEVEISEIVAVRHSDRHRWYYLSDMSTEEALLLKNYDSQRSGVARFSPHTSFDDPNAPVQRPPRASIEVRVLTIW